MTIRILACDVCGHDYPAGDGQLGDICQACGWEVDDVEDCPAVAAWEVSRGLCSAREAEDALHACLCHLDAPGARSRMCGFSAANHGTIRDARRAYASGLTRAERRAWIIRRAVAGCRAEYERVWLVTFRNCEGSRCQREVSAVSAHDARRALISWADESVTIDDVEPASA